MLKLTRRLAVSSFAAATVARAAENPDDLVSVAPTGTLSFTHDGGAIILDISVNGAPPAPFLFDTGATLTTLDSDYADRLGLRTVGGGKTVGIKGGQQPVGLLTTTQLAANGMALPAQDVGVLGFPNHIVDRGARPRLAGIIGLNGFGSQILRIDFAHSQLTLLPGDAQPNPAGITLKLTSALRFGNSDAFSPLVSYTTLATKIEDLDADLVLDSGAGGSVVLRHDFVEQNDLAARYPRHVDMRQPGGIDGSLLGSFAIGKELRIGPVTIKQPMLLLSREEADQPGAINFRGVGDDARRRSLIRPHNAGVLGMRALAAYTLFLDLASQRLVLEPGGVPRGPTILRSVGLSLDKPAHDYFKVLSVVPNTPAAAAGIAEGDRIVAVNGTKATELALFDYGRLQESGPITVRLANGATHSLSAVQLLP